MILVMAIACEKEKVEFKNSSTINIIHAAVGFGPLKINQGGGNGFVYSKANDLNYSSSAFYGALTGNISLTVVNAIDTTKALLTKSLNLAATNTLYLIGRLPNIDTMFRVEQNLPRIDKTSLSQDNSIYIRFVNLSPNSTPLNINIRSVTTNEVSGLEYKGVSAFKKYEALSNTANYIFEIRDAATNITKATYTLNTNSNRYKTISLVIKGLMDTSSGTDAFGVLLVNYFN